MTTGQIIALAKLAGRVNALELANDRVDAAIVTALELGCSLRQVAEIAGTSASQLSRRGYAQHQPQPSEE